MKKETPEEFINNRIDEYTSGGRLDIEMAIQLLDDYRKHLESFNTISTPEISLERFCKHCQETTPHKHRRSKKTGHDHGYKCLVCSMKYLKEWTSKNKIVASERVIEHQQKYITTHQE